MRIPRSLTLSVVLACGALPQMSFSQVPPPPAPPAPLQGQPVYDPQQFPAQRGVVQQFTLTDRGDIDGLILKDGTEVKTPPTLSTQLAYSIKPGDQVTIHGLRAAALPLVSAVSITDEATHRTVSDNDIAAVSPPPPPPPGLPPARVAVSELSGRVRMALHGPQGEVNGVLLESGTVLRFPPDQADQWASLLQPRQSIVAQGLTRSTPLGTVLEVQALGSTRSQLQPVGPMLPGDPRGPRADQRTRFAPAIPPVPVGAPPPPPLDAPPPAYR